MYFLGLIKTSGKRGRKNPFGRIENIKEGQYICQVWLIKKTMQFQQSFAKFPCLPYTLIISLNVLHRFPHRNLRRRQIITNV